MQTLFEFLSDDDTSLYGPDTYKARQLIKFWIEMKKCDEVLDLSDVNIHTMPPLPDSIEFIICCNEHIIYISSLPKCLKNLILSYSSNLRRIPLLPECLELLDIAGTLIRRLPNMPCGLKILDATSSSLNYLGQLYTGIENINLTRTPIKKFVGLLPDSLIVLKISGTDISYLPNFPKRLKILDAVLTPLKILPEFPFSLQIIHVNGCKDLLIKRREIIDDFGRLTLEDIYQYGERWLDWHEEQKRAKRFIIRNDNLSIDLLKKYWYPTKMADCSNIEDR